MKLARLKKLSPEEQKKRTKFARIFKIYGITEDEYKSLDKGYCPVCLKTWSVTIIPCVDHDHSTNRVRGLLCRYCNRYRVGHFRDHDMVKRIYDYLVDALRLPNYIVPLKPKKKRRIRKKK